MMIGIIIYGAMKFDTFANAIRIIVFLIAFHKIGNEVANHKLMIVA